MLILWTEERFMKDHPEGLTLSEIIIAEKKHRW